MSNSPPPPAPPIKTFRIRGRPPTVERKIQNELFSILIPNINILYGGRGPKKMSYWVGRRGHGRGQKIFVRGRRGRFLFALNVFRIRAQPIVSRDVTNADVTAAPERAALVLRRDENVNLARAPSWNSFY